MDVLLLSLSSSADNFVVGFGLLDLAGPKTRYNQFLRSNLLISTFNSVGALFSSAIGSAFAASASSHTSLGIELQFNCALVSASVFLYLGINDVKQSLERKSNNCSTTETDVLDRPLQLAFPMTLNNFAKLEALLKSTKKNDGSDHRKITRLENEGSKVVIGGKDGNSRNYAAGGAMRSGQD